MPKGLDGTEKGLGAGGDRQGAGTRPGGWEGESGPGLLPCTHKLGKVVDLAPCQAPLCATGVESLCSDSNWHYVMVPGPGEGAF